MAEFITETNGRFVETDKRMAEFITETNGRFAETDKKLVALTEAQARTDEQIKALILTQTRTDEMVRSLLERNGSTAKPRARAKKPAAKKAKKTTRG
jgi:hypothetical protein